MREKAQSYLRKTYPSRIVSVMMIMSISVVSAYYRMQTRVCKWWSHPTTARVMPLLGRVGGNAWGKLFVFKRLRLVRVRNRRNASGTARRIMCCTMHFARKRRKGTPLALTKQNGANGALSWNGKLHKTYTEGPVYRKKVNRKGLRAVARRVIN